MGSITIRRSNLLNLLVMTGLFHITCVFGQAPDVLGGSLRIPLQQPAPAVADPGPPALEPPQIGMEIDVERAEKEAEAAEKAKKAGDTAKAEKSSNQAGNDVNGLVNGQ